MVGWLYFLLRGNKPFSILVYVAVYLKNMIKHIISKRRRKCTLRKASAGFIDRFDFPIVVDF